MPAEPGPIDGPNHAMVTGFVLGALRSAGVNAEPVLNLVGDYTDTILMRGAVFDVRLKVSIAPDN